MYFPSAFYLFLSSLLFYDFVFLFFYNSEKYKQKNDKQVFYEINYCTIYVIKKGRVVKKAFTMIELIFVIVILGILAAVAIPKLAATRDDAQVSLIAQDIGTAIGEISSYATSKSTINTNFLVMSNAIQKMQNAGYAALSNNKAIISIDGVNCIKMEVIKNATNDDLKISDISSTNQQCLSLQSAIDAQNYSIKLRGTSVNY